MTITEKELKILYKNNEIKKIILRQRKDKKYYVSVILSAEIGEDSKEFPVFKFRGGRKTWENLNLFVEHVKKNYLQTIIIKLK